ncbi:MAG: exosortase/archaeosortase family protein, partial [Gemmataceae bacterium]|nr:exosortase/archaeosortase family protein [Gemmataceae bacterium]
MLCAWAYWPTLARMAGTWASNPEYSHGFLVPLFAGYLLWARRERLGEGRPAFSAWGPAVLAGAGLLRVGGALLGIDYLDSLSLVACAAGLVVLFGGLPAMRWAWPSLLFLLFMIPLPFGLATSLSGMLRTVATQASGFVLQMVGLPTVIEGHTLLVGEDRIAVAEACSGLSMLYVFLALATAVAILVERPWLDKAVILASAIPIAVAANVVRIAATAFAFQVAGKKMGEWIYHDLAGWLMMPLALGMLLLVLRL